MSEEESTKTTSRGTAFVLAGALVLVVAVVGVVLALLLDSGEPGPPPSPTVEEPPNPTVEEPAADDSVCGLPGEEWEGGLDSPPPTEWDYQGTTAYPISDDHGPAETDENEVRYCFERSPEGALLMAANAVTQGSDSAVAEEWLEYAVAAGPYREQLLAAPSDDPDALRMEIAGFRLLDYDGDGTRIDLLIRGSSQGETQYLSGVYDLVWHGGDWKISAESANPIDLAVVPDPAGYVDWGSDQS